MSLSIILNTIDQINKRQQLINKYQPKITTKHLTKSLIINNPVIELYEFTLKGYPSYNKPIQFGEIFDTKINECGMIKATKDKDDENKIASCDIISSEDIQQIGGIFNINQLNEYYLLSKAKEKIRDIKQYESSIDVFKECFEHVIKINNDYINANKNISDKIPDYKTNLEDLHTGALVYKINVTTADKIIIFGDHHGSYHTFYRNMLRLHRIGAINLKTWEITNGYKLIFLGDIVDRGENAIEILSVISNFIIKNNTTETLKIILNRGNHEESQVYGRYGFISELTKKGLGKLEQTIKRMFTVCPSAIIIEDSNKQRYWLSHGGFPLINIISERKRKMVNAINADPMNYTDNKKIWFHSGDIVIIPDVEIDVSIPSQIRWNDFAYSDKNYPCKLGTRGVYGVQLNNHIVSEFMKLNNIHFIIRAHQDSVANSWILGRSKLSDGFISMENATPTYINELTNVPIGIYKNSIADISKNAVNGPVCRISVNDIDKINGTSCKTTYDNFGRKATKEITLYPIITLSTNTDYERDLTKDSFAILRFDVTSDILNNFSKEINILDPRNVMENNISDLL